MKKKAIVCALFMLSFVVDASAKTNKEVPRDHVSMAHCGDHHVILEDEGNLLIVDGQEYVSINGEVNEDSVSEHYQSKKTDELMTVIVTKKTREVSLVSSNWKTPAYCTAPAYPL